MAYNVELIMIFFKCPSHHSLFLMIVNSSIRGDSELTLAVTASRVLPKLTDGVHLVARLAVRYLTYHKGDDNEQDLNSLIYQILSHVHHRHSLLTINTITTTSQALNLWR